MLNNPLLPTAYFAPIYYYAILVQSKSCIIESHENFIKQSIRNRCEIYNSNGKLRLSIPLIRKRNSKTKIAAVKIAYNENWQKTHWKSIISAYNSSPFFEYYKDNIEQFFIEKEPYLINFNNKIQEVIIDLIQEKISINESKKYQLDGPFKDYRNFDFKIKNAKRYNQVFMEKHRFIANLSILDLLFNLGPESSNYLRNLNINQ